MGHNEEGKEMSENLERIRILLERCERDKLTQAD